MELAQLLFDPDWYQKTYNFNGNSEHAWFDFCNQDRWERWPNRYFDPVYYLYNAQDIASAGINPFVHYCSCGWMENRLVHRDQPGYNLESSRESDWWESFFWSDWYIEQQVRLAWSADIQNDTLMHFLKLGCMALLQPNPFFSPKYYIDHNFEPSQFIYCASTHYLRNGWIEKRSHHWLFDLKYQQLLHSDQSIPLLIQYFNSYLDCKWLHPNPSYAIEAPSRLGRAFRRKQIKSYVNRLGNIVDPINPILQRALIPSSMLDIEAIEHKYANKITATHSLQLVAFYLPQFHCIPENDKWWGEGFTEWTNTLKAKPLYPGHWQPHRPHKDLGYYDLGELTAIKAQVGMAKQYGITAFCFYHYCFGDSRLLDKPVNIWLENKSLDLQFCLCWANESWTRRWDGSPNDVLIEQPYGADYIEKLGKSLLSSLQDNRYLKISGLPVLLVYRVLDLPDPIAFSTKIRRYMRENGVGEIMLFSIWSFDRLNPNEIGFDAAVQFPPLQVPTPDLSKDMRICNENGSNPKVYGYPELIRHYVTELEQSKNYTLYAAVSPSWDNTARKAGNSVSWLGASVDRFSRWVELAKRQTMHINRGTPLLFVNAWNEWGEGCHLEPDSVYGYGWLEALSSSGMAIIGHDAFNAGSQRSLLSLLSELKNQWPSLRMELLLLDDGDLFSSYMNTCPTILISSEKAIERISGLLSTVDNKIVLGNTILSLSILLQVKASDKDGKATICLQLCELLTTVREMGYWDELKEAQKYLNYIICPSPQLAKSLVCELGYRYDQLIVFPPSDDMHLNNRRAITPLESKFSGEISLMSCGRDLESYICFEACYLGIKNVFSRLNGIWLGPVKPRSPVVGLNWIEQGDVTSLLKNSDFFFVCSCGPAKRGETYGLVASEAIRLGIPVIDFGQPLGVKEFLPNYPSILSVQSVDGAISVVRELIHEKQDDHASEHLSDVFAKLMKIGIDWRTREKRLFKQGVSALVNLLKSKGSG